MKAFAMAIEGSPTDVAAAHNLFDLQLELGDLKGAEATVWHMQTHQPGAATQAAQVRLRLRSGDYKAAAKGLEALCTSPDPDAWPLSAAGEAFKRAGRMRDAIKVFRRALRAPAANPQAAASAIALLIGQRTYLATVRLFLRLADGEARNRAAVVLMQGLGDGQRRWLIRWLLWRRGDVFRRHDAAWGQAGYALSSVKSMRRAVEWMNDWRQRSSVEPWMLFNHCLALRHVGRNEESSDLARYVVKTWGHREGTADLRLFLAVEDVLAGRTVEAAEQLNRVQVRERNAYDQQLLALAKAAVKFLQSPLESRRRVAAEVRRELGDRIPMGTLASAMRDVRRTFGRIGNLIYKEGGGLSSHVWFAWRLHWPWMVVPLGLLVGAAVLGTMQAGDAGPILTTMGAVLLVKLLQKSNR